MMEVIKELSEEEFLDLAFIIYCMGYPEYVIDQYQKSDKGARLKRKIKTRVEEWLEISNGRSEMDQDCH